MNNDKIAKKMTIWRNAVSALAMAAVIVCGSCSDDNPGDEPEPTPEPTPEQPTAETELTDTEMRVSGVWAAGTEITLDRHLVVPEGKTLTIEPGVKVIVSTAGVGVNHVPVEVLVKGSLYCQGCAEAPILFSVEEGKRTAENALKGLWGGIVATETCAEMVIDHTVIEYTGAQVIEGSPSATAGYYTAGDDAYPQITTNNIGGKYVITNSVLRNGWSDGIYLMGGSAIITNNVFAANGYSGGEAVNVKAGVVADVAGNIMFSPNTNGLKLSSSGQSETRGQAKVNAYNNTIINAGWRRDGEKGGCVYVEKNCLANVVNNLMVNCKFRAMTPSYKTPNVPDGGYDDKSIIDYNCYASGSQRSTVVYPEESNVAYAYEGYNYAHKSYNPAVDAHSLISTADNLINPLFVNYDINGVALTEYRYDEGWNFHLLSGSPALTGALMVSPFTPYFAGGIVLNGVSYASPALAGYFGAAGM